MIAVYVHRPCASKEMKKDFLKPLANGNKIYLKFTGI